MGFGFVVARFGLFLQELEVDRHIPPMQSYGLSLWFGTALITAGVVVNLLAGWQHVRLVHELDRGQTTHSRPPALAAGIAVFLAMVGFAMASYLVSVRTSEPSNFQRDKEISMPPITDNGIITKPSNHSVDETVERLKALLQAKGVALFALVDHSGEARKAGLIMPPTKLLIFGSPKGGTPLMLAAPSTAIDLPLKVLVAEDAQGRVSISYNSPAYLQQRHGFPTNLLQNIAIVETFAGKAAE
jgi:uncharacterized protein (DUF302 family)/uncharacterized membrane protein YidH (DUF202 family)